LLRLPLDVPLHHSNDIDETLLLRLRGTCFDKSFPRGGFGKGTKRHMRNSAGRLICPLIRKRGASGEAFLRSGKARPLGPCHIATMARLEMDVGGTKSRFAHAARKNDFEQQTEKNGEAGSRAQRRSTRRPFTNQRRER